MPAQAAPLSVTAITGTAALGGAERVLLDFANRAFEHDIALRVLTPLDGPLVSILNKIGVPAEVIPAPKTLTDALRRGRWYSPGAMAGMYQWSRRLVKHPFVTGADVVYTVAYRAHVAARLAGLAPVVWHLHSFPPRAARRFWHAAARQRPARLIANSEAVADAWRPGLLRPTERLRVVHNGVNLDRFRPRDRTGWIHEQLGLPLSHRLIGMPSVFARWKGHLEVLEAFEDIAVEFPDVHLVILGGTIYQTDEEHSLGQELKRATGEFRVVSSGAIPADGRTGGPAEERSELGSHPGVHMLPFQREIELAYPEFDLTVHYSLKPEPFGRVVLESMACGVPIVAASEGGPVEILGNGVEAQIAGGWLVEPRNPKALTSVFRRALARPVDELRSIGAAGRIRAEDHFSSRAFAGRVAAVLREACSV
jgi:glycosyltransferase involved in cell wall biosynthesis